MNSDDKYLIILNTFFIHNNFKFIQTINLFPLLILIPETQKRRRFHNPLRNLRRIFRRRTVTHADVLSTNSTTNPTPTTLTTTSSSSTSTLASTTHTSIQAGAHAIDVGECVGGQNNSLINNQQLHHHSHHQLHSPAHYNNINHQIHKEKREHSADGLRQKGLEEELDRDMTDYQRSLSEGRLVDRYLFIYFINDITY